MHLEITKLLAGILVRYEVLPVQLVDYGCQIFHDQEVRVHVHAAVVVQQGKSSTFYNFKTQSRVGTESSNGSTAFALHFLPLWHPLHRSS